MIADSFLMGGKSDPYVKLTCCHVEQTSTTIKQNLNPTWDEQFEWKGEREALLGSGLHVNVMDWDRLKSDDPLGEVHVMLDALRSTEFHEYTVPLPTQGVVAFTAQWLPDAPSAAAPVAALSAVSQAVRQPPHLACCPAFSSSIPAAASLCCTPARSGLSATPDARMPPQQHSAVRAPCTVVGGTAAMRGASYREVHLDLSLPPSSTPPTTPPLVDTSAHSSLKPATPAAAATPFTAAMAASRTCIATLAAVPPATEAAETAARGGVASAQQQHVRNLNAGRGELAARRDQKLREAAAALGTSAGGSEASIFDEC